MMNEEEKYLDIREKLRALPKVKAGENFMSSLQAKINLEEAAERNTQKKFIAENRGGFLKNLFGNRSNPWLVPAMGFAVLLVGLFTIFYMIRQKEPVNNFTSKDVQVKDSLERIKPITQQQPPQSFDEKKSVEPKKEPEVIADKRRTEPEKNNRTDTRSSNIPGKNIASNDQVRPPGTDKNLTTPPIVMSESSPKLRSGTNDTSAKSDNNKEVKKKEERTSGNIPDRTVSSAVADKFLGRTLIDKSTLETLSDRIKK
jgi:negative regulator of sigma E activity